MKIKEHQEIILLETPNGDWRRIFDHRYNELSWQNDHKAYRLQDDGTWKKLSTRKQPEIIDRCILEDEYQQLIRKEKINRLVNGNDKE